MPNCGSCTACCFALPINAIAKPKNVLCQYCDGGCSIYENKPTTCTEFQCAYNEVEGVPEALRPDNCGVIFIKRTDSRFDGVVIPDAEVTDMAKRQIESFKSQGFEVNFGYL